MSTLCVTEIRTAISRGKSVARVIDNSVFSHSARLRLPNGSVVIVNYSGGRGASAVGFTGSHGAVGVHYELITETTEGNDTMTTRINATDLEVGAKYILKQERHGIPRGTEVLFERYDSDGDPVFRRTDDSLNGLCASTCWVDRRSTHAYIKLSPSSETLSNKWIAWNRYGSELANSEAEAKRKAESLAKRYNAPAYIAKATNSCKKNDVVWSR